MVTNFNKLDFALLLLWLLFPTPAHAAIVKKAIPCDDAKICLYWWPSLPEIEGWHQETESSLQFRFNALAPDGYTFSNADAIIYAKALYKLGAPEIKTLDMLIADDRNEFIESDPSILISETTPLTTGNGQSLKSLTFFPKSAGNWERVSYGEEGDFYLIFTISARNSASYDKAMPTYERMISNYKE